MELVAQAVTLSLKIADAYQSAPKQRGRCKAVVEQISSLGTLLTEIKPALPNPLTPQVKTCFEVLNDALKKAYRLMEKTSKASTIKYILMSKQVMEDLSSVSCDIEACLRGLPLIQLAQTSEIRSHVQHLQTSFEDVGKQLKEQSVFTREQHDLAAEVLTILRSRDSQETNSTRLISWLSEQFDADIQSVRNEFQDLKKNLSQLNEQAERSVVSKSMVEAELLEQIVLCIDQLEARRADSIDVIDHTGIPGEFKCGICLGVMEMPVIISTGHSFCKVCIEKTFRTGPPTCPYSRTPLNHDLLIDNIALRGAISRWCTHMNSEVKEVSKPEKLFSRSYSFETVKHMIEELGRSPNHIKLKSLNDLLEVSTSPDGPALIFKLDGVASIVSLLDSSNRKITEKVTTILAQLTRASASSSEDSDALQLLNYIFESCIDKLINLVTEGTRMTRLRAAETLGNLLFIPEVTECLLSEPGIVSSLAALARESEDALEICLRGLGMLSRNNDRNFTGNDALVACLVDLLHSEENHAVEEAVVALKSAMSSGGSRACIVLRTKTALPNIVRCAMTGGIMQEAAFIILEQFGKQEGFNELADAGFTKHIAALVSSSGLPENKELFARVLRLSKGCLESTRDASVELAGLRSSIPRLMNVLPVREYTAEVLALLKTFCVKDSTCKELILECDGLQKFQEFSASSLSASRKGALALISILLHSASCQEAFARAGGIETLSNVTLMDENVECITEAVVSLSVLATNPKLRRSVLESLELEKFVSFMDEKFPVHCREAAASISVHLLAEESSPPLTKQSLKLLMNVAQQGESVAVRRRAGKLLLMNATSRGLEDASKMVSLEVFLALADGAGEVYRDLLQRFICCFSQSQTIFESGATPFLLNALTIKKHQRDAAGSIKNLVRTVPSSHETLLEAGFGQTGIEFLSSGCEDSTCIVDVSASMVSVYANRRGDPNFMALIRALVQLLKNPSQSLEVISSTACSIFHLLPLDSCESLSLLKNTELIRPLLLLLGSGSMFEALELLAVAVEAPHARGELCKQDGIPKLVHCLGVQNHRAQELASGILLTLGKPSDSISDNRLDEIRRSMLSSGIVTSLLSILEEPSHVAVRNSACLIRNLGRSGQNAPAEEKVFTVLFNLLRFYMNSSSTEGYTERLKYVFLALRLFFSDRRLKMLVRTNLGLVHQALITGYGDYDNDIKSCALSLVLELFEEASMSKDVANALASNSISSLRNIMQNSSDISCKRSACVVLKLVIRCGSNPQQACRWIRERQCIKVVVALKQSPGCSKEANDVLELMKKHDKESRVSIAHAENDYFPWGRTNSANF